MKKQIIILGLTLLLGNFTSRIYAQPEGSVGPTLIIASSALGSGTTVYDFSKTYTFDIPTNEYVIIKVNSYGTIPQYLDSVLNLYIGSYNFRRVIILAGKYKTKKSIIVDRWQAASNTATTGGITIEGEGNSTIIMNDSAAPVFVVKSNFNTIKNLRIAINDTKATSGIQLYQDYANVRKVENNIFENIYIGHWNIENVERVDSKFIGIELKQSQHSNIGYNKFSNITLQSLYTGILFTTDGITYLFDHDNDATTPSIPTLKNNFNDNVFENINIKDVFRGISFQPAVSNPSFMPLVDYNTFQNIALQTSLWTKYFVENVSGTMNYFTNCKAADWSSKNKLITGRKVFTISPSSTYTTIANSRLATADLHNNVNDITDSGFNTQLINNYHYSGMLVNKIGVDRIISHPYRNNDKGLTEIKGRLKLSASSGSLPSQSADPTFGNNKVLTSDSSGYATWRDISTIGITANQGITKVGNEVRLGDACGGSGAPFTQNREINLSNFNLYFNSKSPQSGAISDGKIYMGANSCQTLQSRLEISTAGQSNGPLNDYATPNPSTSGLRFRDLTAVSPSIQNMGSGVLSLDKEGDVIWVKRDLNGTCSTPNLILKSIGSNQYSCSQIFDNGTSVGVSTTGPFTYTTTGAAWTSGSPAASGTAKFSVNGLGRFTSLVVTSDMNLKKDIEAIENPNAIIEKLEGKTYAWKDEVVKEALIDNGRHYGFLAQEVEKVMPEAVIKDEKGRYAVEYNAFIPVLVESQKALIKETEILKEELSDLKSNNELLIEKLALLEKSISKLCESGCVGLEMNKEMGGDILYQSVPNPTDDIALISYYLASKKSSSNISLMSQEGKIIKVIPIDNIEGKGFVKLSLGDLANGTYYYSLIVDNKTVDTKKLQIVKMQ